jgi:hypothetical protein
MHCVVFCSEVPDNASADKKIALATMARRYIQLGLSRPEVPALTTAESGRYGSLFRRKNLVGFVWKNRLPRDLGQGPRLSLQHCGASIFPHADFRGLAQRRSRLRFLHEALLSFGVGDLLGGQDLDGDLTSQAALDGTVDLVHPSRP